MSSKYPLNRSHVASGNRVGQRGVGEVLQPAHPIGRIDFLGVQATARGAHHFERERVFGAELILQRASEARGEGAVTRRRLRLRFEARRA